MVTGPTVTLEEYRNSPSEIARANDLLALIPKNLSSVLDIGARDGHFSRLLRNYFKSVTALDLTAPTFLREKLMVVQGDVTELPFCDNSFDVVFCAEVLEHIFKLKEACSEIERVARRAVVIGVPFLQDTRRGRTTCNHCGTVNPPWGHVNTFSEHKLIGLFPRCFSVKKSFIGSASVQTNALSTILMDLAGNPWGVYNQEEPCIVCGSRMNAPTARSFLQKSLAAVALRLDRILSTFTAEHPYWIHVLFQKHGPDE